MGKVRSEFESPWLYINQLFTLFSNKQGYTGKTHPCIEWKKPWGGAVFRKVARALTSSLFLLHCMKLCLRRLG